MELHDIKQNALNYFAERGYTVLQISRGELSYSRDRKAPAPDLAFVMRGGDIVFITIASSAALIGEDGVARYARGTDTQRAFNKAGAEHHAIKAKTLGTAIAKIGDILAGHTERSSIGVIGKGDAESRMYA